MVLDQHRLPDVIASLEDARHECARRLRRLGYIDRPFLPPPTVGLERHVKFLSSHSDGWHYASLECGHRLAARQPFPGVSTLRCRLCLPCNREILRRRP